MTYKLHWTDEAQLTYDENLAYLESEWDINTFNKFLYRIDEVLKSISETPEIYPIKNEIERIHKCVVNKHITLYFRIVNSSQIDLISFWNTHQNPDNLKL